MNDPLKKFVQQYREAFDRLEPSAEVLQRLQQQLRPTPARQGHVFQKYPWTIGLVAASLLIGLCCTYLLFDGAWLRHENEPHVALQPVEKKPLMENPPVVQEAESPNEGPVVEPPEREARNVAVQPEPISKPLAVRLADSSSASTRLAAILEIEQSGRMDDRLRTMLSETMDRDGNTNVRLAALDVLSRHLNDPEVASLLAAALTGQDDPLVQLGIVRIAAQIDHMGIEEALFAVARSPYTFPAVKDEAYAVLLHQEKL